MISDVRNRTVAGLTARRDERIRYAVKSCPMCRTRDNIRALRRVGCDDMQVQQNKSFLKASFKDKSYLIRVRTKKGIQFKASVKDDAGLIVGIEKIAFKSQLIKLDEHIKKGIPYTLKGLPTYRQGKQTRLTLANFDGKLLTVAINEQRGLIPLEDSTIDWIQIPVKKESKMDESDKGYMSFYKAHSRPDSKPVVKIFWIEDIE